MPLYTTFDGADDFASVPDDAGFSALGDFSVVTAISCPDWTPGADGVIQAQQTNAGNQRSWTLLLLTTSGLRLNVSTNGSTQTSHSSTTTTGFTNGTTHWVLMTRAAAAGEVKFYTADFTPGSVTPPAIGSFTQLGSTVTGVTTSNLFNSTAPLTIAANGGGTINELACNVYRSVLYSGLYGSGSETVLVDFDPTNDSGGVGDTSWSEGTYTWTLGGNAAVVADIVTGAAVGASTASGTATGLRSVLAAGAGASTGSGTATGVRTVLASAAGASVASGTATGSSSAVVTGVAAGTASASGTATGTRTVNATATGTANAEGSATGLASKAGTAAGAASSSGTAVAVRIVLGTSAGASVAAGTVTGVRTVTALAGGASTATGTGAGLRTVLAVAQGASSATGSGSGTSAAPSAHTGTATGAAIITGSAVGFVPIDVNRIVASLDFEEERRPFLVGAPGGLARLPEQELWWGEEP